MAQTGYTPILIYSSSTAAAAPTAGNLTNSTLGSELAINITDGKLFYKDNANAIQVIGWKTVPTSAGGTGLTSYTAGDLIYYASGTTFTKLGIGSAYQALQVNAGGTAPSWQPSASSVLTAQGDLLYASAANTLARLAKNTTATRYLANTGTSNNPDWAQVNLANGVTGTLPVGNGGTGTGTAFTAGSVVFAGASGVYSQNNAQLFWDNSNNRLGIGTASPTQPVQLTWNFNGSTWYYVTNSNAGNGAAVGLLFATDQGSGASGAISQNSSGNTDKAVNALRIRNLLNAPIVFETNGVENARIFSSGGVSIGNTTDPGATNLSVTGRTVSALFRTDSGQIVPASGVTTTIFTCPTLDNGCYIVTCNIPGQAPPTYSAVGLVRVGGTTLSFTSLAAATTLTISVSGQNIRVVQNSGGTNAVDWTVIRIS